MCRGEIEKSSFRDRSSGTVFFHDNILYRQINTAYGPDYDYVINSGLYKDLTNLKLLVPHEEVEGICPINITTSYKIIKPLPIPFISYPYEWCFSQLKAAALCTLHIQKTALRYGMTLKDASAYNIQFLDSNPILIDTLSFERAKDFGGWNAYGQFCKHFLAPLVLMKYVDLRLNQLLRIYIDGIPLDLCSSLLPKRALIGSLFIHIYLHSKLQQKCANWTEEEIKKKIHKPSLKNALSIIEDLESYISRLTCPKKATEWGGYYTITNYTEDSFLHKKRLVSTYASFVQPKTAWDLGGNEGVFSRVLSNLGVSVCCWDIDPMAVEENYSQCQTKKEKNILPLLLDLTNPSGGIGWGNAERSSLAERGKVDLVMALALIHHLSISNNVPFSMVAKYLASLCRHLIIEFIPKEDSKVMQLLSSRKDVFDEYSESFFEKEFSFYFSIARKDIIEGSRRTLYLMERKNV